MSVQKYDETFNQASKVAIVANPVARSFNVVLDAKSTNSWTGTQFNAFFTVDFTQVVREAWRLNKSYYMKFSFVSSAAASTTNTIVNNNVYTLHIDLGKAPNIYRYNNVRVPSGIVRVSNEGSTALTNTYFNSRPDDNAPIFIENLRDIISINLNLINATAQETFNTANNDPINQATKYVCMLTFTEA